MLRFNPKTMKKVAVPKPPTKKPDGIARIGDAVRKVFIEVFGDFEQKTQAAIDKSQAAIQAVVEKKADELDAGREVLESQIGADRVLLEEIGHVIKSLPDRPRVWRFLPKYRADGRLDEVIAIAEDSADTKLS